MMKDKRLALIPVGCGKCIECMKQKRRAWQVRLLEDIKEHKNAKFITLTFSNEAIKLLSKDTIDFRDKYINANEMARLAIRRFLERWRKKYKKSLRHWLVTELGQSGTQRIHIHGIIYTDESKEIIAKYWQYGYIWIGDYVNATTITYITKYVSKQDLLHPNYIPKIFTSPGIGSYYLKRYDSGLNVFNGLETKEYYRTDTGHKINLPIYYRNKIYDEYEREELWLQKLDREERYVCGERVSVANGNEEVYERLREYYREKSATLGYPGDKKNWSEINYKNYKKILMKKEV